MPETNSPSDHRLPGLSEQILRPSRVVLLGASSQQGSVGHALLQNLEAGADRFEFHAINPHRVDVELGTWHASIDDLPSGPGLAVIALPARLVPQSIREIGAKGIDTAIVISANLGPDTELGGELLAAARDTGVRMLGPNCLGLFLPHVGINASFATTTPKPGGMALLSQSGAIVTGIVEWAEAQEIGFSAIISVGDMAQTGLGELIEVLADDERTEAILLYVEGLKAPERFLQAARKASCAKPVIALKAGRSLAAGRAALSHTGALAGSSEVYEAAFADVGVVQVGSLDEFFDAAEAVYFSLPACGPRLAILTNGGGAGILAVDALDGTEAQLAELSADTIERLNKCLPRGWSQANPVDIIGDADAERYRASVAALLEDEASDAVLVMNCPTAVLAPGEAAEIVADAVTEARKKNCRKPVIGCWLGPANLASAEPHLREAGIAAVATPSQAVEAFNFLLKRSSAQAAALAVPAAKQADGELARARQIIAGARADGRKLLSEVEGKQLLECFDIPVVHTVLASSVEEVERCCADIVAPYVVKIVSPEIVHKSDVGGVAVGLATAEEARKAAQQMADRVQGSMPEARIDGFALQQMVERKGAMELFAGMIIDATFGPVIAFGAGGTAIEVINDKSIALPPVSREKAHATIERTRISRLMKGYRDVPPVDSEGVAKVLAALSVIARALPEIAEIDVNPLLADQDGVVGLDARVVLSA